MYQPSRVTGSSRLAPVSWFAMTLAMTLATSLVTPVALFAQATPATPARGDAERLVASLLGDTPLLKDLETLSDEVGGRATGSPNNLRAVEWGLARFRDAGVTVRREAFTMPSRWLERSASATVTGPDGISFSPRVAAMPFSVATPRTGTRAALLDAGAGAESDFARLGGQAAGAFLLVEQGELADIDGLFKEYDESAAIEVRARAARALGVVYMGSRPNDLLYRHNVAIGARNTLPMLVMESDGARRALRLLRAGKALALNAMLDLDIGPAYESYNVVGEIEGSAAPRDIVVIGAHLDAWDLGDGALDNGANAALVIDLARQMKRLGIAPARTVRFVLWNGEEQGMEGSAGYVRLHVAEMDHHAMAMSVDIGCGRITGFFTGGRPALPALVDRALDPVRGLGPFEQLDVPIVGTDNFDFMLQGVPNLVANQEPASYGPNYHARSDTFDKCDGRQLRQNAAIAAAVVYSFAQGRTALPRQTRAEVEALMQRTDLPKQMRTFNLWEEWAAGTRGRSK